MRFTFRIPFLARDTQPPSMTERFFAAQNEARTYGGITGLAPYWWNEVAARAAQARADDLVARDYFSHDTPDGEKGYTQELRGVSYSWAGENIAANNYPASEAVERAITTLMNSPTHRANILDPVFESCGIGYAIRPTKVHVFVSIFLAGVGP